MTPEDSPDIRLAKGGHKPVPAGNPSLIDEVAELPLEQAAHDIDRPSSSSIRALPTREAGPGPLARLLSDLRPVPVLADGGGGSAAIQAPPGNREPTWLQLGDWRLFARVNELKRPTGAVEIARFAVTGGGSVSAWQDADGGLVGLPFSPEEAYLNYISEASAHAASRRRLSSAQLDAFYRVKRFVPRRVQLGSRRLYHRLQGLPAFPRWPLEDGAHALLRFLAYCSMLASGTSEMRFRWFWPHGHTAAIVLTHDVESIEGLGEMVAIADLEEERGFRSSFNLGAWYTPDPGILRELRSRGFEIGLHGIRHDRSMFASRASFEEQQRALRRLGKLLEATGFRSPATHRIFDWLAELPVEYDCSIPHSDPFEPQPGGCCSPWPFLIGAVVELPYTLPQDHTVFTLLGQRTPQLWLDVARGIESRNGLIQCLTHPDPGYLGDAWKRRLYGEFLDAIADRDTIWRALPADVATWWRGRHAAAGGTLMPPFGEGVAERGAAATDVSFHPATS
jgi:peptidoglycan/xylan/chitin deacetylase (PgdA/CDA1 family)